MYCPLSTADLTRQLTIVDSNIDVESDHKLQLKWSTPQPHLEAPKHPGEYVVGEWPPKGRVYWKLPFKVGSKSALLFQFKDRFYILRSHECSESLMNSESKVMAALALCNLQLCC